MNTGVLALRNISVCDHLMTNGPYFQIVRWKRKPIWLPPVKSKLFKIPKRPYIPVEQQVEFRRLNNNYKTYIKSLSYFFTNQCKSNMIETNVEALQALADKDFLECSEINDKWNKTIAEERSNHSEQKRHERMEKIKARLELVKQRDLKKSEELEKEVKQVMEQASTFITADNIDKAIEDALATTVDHNYAVTKHGKIYK